MFIVVTCVLFLEITIMYNNKMHDKESFVLLCLLLKIKVKVHVCIDSIDSIGLTCSKIDKINMNLINTQCCTWTQFM